VIISSRSYDEYVAMFDLDADDMSGTVLDCSAGAASFVTVARSHGTKAYAVDPAYAMSREELARAVHDDLQRGSTIAEQHPDRFVWDWFGSREDRDRMRRTAGARFLAALATSPDWIVAGELPRLPFRDGSFDLVLCSHLLFTWADVLGFDWHRAAVLELARVSRREVRVFPTVLQGRGDVVPFWSDLMTALDEHGLVVDERPVPYRFQVTGERMLAVSRRG
jgi:SAM-dependent methyltransferase